MVPVALVEANRIRLAQLWATNQFGINLPAIAETEDEYQSMWGNNSASMSRYRRPGARHHAAAVLVPGRDCQSGGVGRPSQCGVVGDHFDDDRCQLSDLFDHLGDPGLRPEQRLGRIGHTYANQFISSGIPINLLSYLAQLSAAQSLQKVGGDVGSGLAEGQGALGGVAGGAAAFGAAGLSAEPTAAIGVGVSMGS